MASIDGDDENIWTAAAHGDVDSLRAALKSGADLNEGDYDYRYVPRGAASREP